MSTIEKVPEEVLLAAIDGASAREKEILSGSADLSRRLQKVRDDFKRDIRAAIGPDKLDEYQKLHERTKQRFLDVITVTRPTTDSLKLSARLRKKILAEAKQAVARLGINARAVEELQKKSISEARAEVERTFKAREEAPYVEVSSENVPTQLHNPWDWRLAPYAGQWGTQWSDGSRGSRWASHFENRMTGEIDCWSGMSLYGADDSDYSYTNAYSELQFQFRMPAAGLVEVWLYLQAIDTPWGGCLEDEWGFSDANIQQRSRPYLWVLSPYGSPRYGTLLDYHRGEDEGCWSGSVAHGGDYRYAHLFSFDSYAPGQWVYCGVGIHDYNYFWVNDMSCNTHVTSRWFLRQVAVRSTGAP